MADGCTRPRSIRMTAWDEDPARVELDADVVYRWQEREADRDGELTRIEIRAVSRQRSTVSDFDLSVHLEVDVDDQRFFERGGRSASRASSYDGRDVACRVCGGSSRSS